MRTIPAAMLIAALAPMSISAANFQVKTHQVTPDQYELTVQLTPELNPDQAQSILTPAADQVCAGRSWHWGSHRFNSVAPYGDKTPGVGQQTFVQTVQCGAAAPPDLSSVPAPQGSPTAEDASRVKQTTLDYLSAKDHGDFAKARAVQTEEAKPYMQDDWSKPRAAFNRQAGLPTRREVLRLTWYDNPQGAPRRGRYVAADYRGDYANAGFYCGFAMWYREADGSYRLVREEEGQVSDATVSKVAAADLPALRKQVGCRD